MLKEREKNATTAVKLYVENSSLMQHEVGLGQQGAPYMAE